MMDAAGIIKGKLTSFQAFISDSCHGLALRSGHLTAGSELMTGCVVSNKARNRALTRNRNSAACPVKTISRFINSQIRER